MANKLFHPKPKEKIFCIIRPIPDEKIRLFNQTPQFDFEDPETNEVYQAIRINVTWYPLNNISRFICQICAQCEPADLKLEMKKKYGLSGSDKIGFYLFKLTN